MITNFRIVLISDGPYCLGLLKGYCHARNYEVSQIAANTESINKMITMQPDMIILTLPSEQNQLKAIDLELIREIRSKHVIPVCCLRKINNASGLDRKIESWVDVFLDDPLDIRQLDNFLRSRFSHHDHFIQEKRSKERRAANERRLSLLQNSGSHNKQLGNNKLPKNNNGDCFVAGPFQIDQRAKRVLLNGKSVDLTRKEFELFELLATNVERVFMAEEIIEHLWPANNRATKSDLYQYMHLLRKKIEDDPNNPQWILTIKSFGYRLNVATPVEVKVKEKFNPVPGREQGVSRLN
jgi:DNA-binding response OmpR family regulator